MRAFIRSGLFICICMVLGMSVAYAQALVKAAKKGNLEKVQKLLENGANVNEMNDQGETALMFAGEKGHLDIVNVLLSSGADPCMKNYDGLTAAAIAEKKGFLEIARLLKSVEDKINVERQQKLAEENAPRLAKLRSYQTGVTKEEEFLNDFGTYGDVFLLKIGILTFLAKDSTTTYTVGSIALEEESPTLANLLKNELLLAMRSRERKDPKILGSTFTLYGNWVELIRTIAVLTFKNTILRSIKIIPEDRVSEGEKIVEIQEDSLSKGTTIFDRMVAACGGKQSFDTIRTAIIRTETSVVTQQAELQLFSVITQIFPNKLRQVITTSSGSQTVIYDGVKAWVISSKGNQDLSESELNDVKEGLFHSWFHFFQTKEFKIQYLGEEDDRGKKLAILLVTDPYGPSTKIFVDQTTFLPIKCSYHKHGKLGPAYIEVIFSDIREVAGIKIPFHYLTYSNLEKRAEMKYLEIYLNASVDESLFVKK